MRDRHFRPQNFGNSTIKNTRRLGSSPSLLVAFLLPVSPELQRIWLRQNAQGKGRAEGSILKRDKFGDTSARSADRQKGALLFRGPHRAGVPQRRPVGAEAHPFGWGKHSVRLYAARTHRGAAPAPPAPKGELKCNSEKGTRRRICATVNKKEASPKYAGGFRRQLRIAPVSSKKRPISAVLKNMCLN